MSGTTLKVAAYGASLRGLTAHYSSGAHRTSFPMSVARGFYSTPASVQKHKDDLYERDRINTESTEYSKSGGDGATAHSEEAFKPDQNDPKSQQIRSEQLDSSNPLEVSPANQDVSQPHDRSSGRRTEDSPAKGEREKSSGGGSPPKAGKLT